MCRLPSPAWPKVAVSRRCRAPMASTRRSISGIALGDIFRATLDLGGTLSGEHGIGIAKARYMAWEQSAEVIGWQKRLKRLWDPAGLLNPGKIFEG